MANTTFKLQVDTDKSEGVHLVDLFTFDPLLNHDINPNLAQDSWNLGFMTSLIDNDPTIAGVQPYDFSTGHFDVVLSASQGTTQLASVHIVIDVI